MDGYRSKDAALELSPEELKAVYHWRSLKGKGPKMLLLMIGPNGRPTAVLGTLPVNALGGDGNGEPQPFPPAT